MIRIWRTLVVALAVGALAATGAVASAVQTGALPSKLVGKWTRKVSSADVNRTKGYGIETNSVWTLTIKSNGQASISGTQGAFHGTVQAVGASRFRTTLGEGAPAVYGWHVSGPKLTLTKVTDATPDREAVFEGVWKRK